MKEVNVATNKAETIAVNLGLMNDIADELNIHICLLVQINRKVEEGKDKHPTIAHLKASGAYDDNRYDCCR